MYEYHERCLKLGPSKIHGTGVFAKKNILTGVEIELVGVEIHPGSLTDKCTNWADDRKFRLGDRLVLPTGFGAYINHSKNPTAEVVLFLGSGLALKILRDVAAGEEITVCYKHPPRCRTPRIREREEVTR